MRNKTDITMLLWSHYLLVRELCNYPPPRGPQEVPPRMPVQSAQQREGQAMIHQLQTRMKRTA